MLSVVNGILELSRIEAHRVAIDHRDFDLTEVVDGAVAVVRQPALAKGLRRRRADRAGAARRRAARRRPAHPAGADQPREQCRQVHRTRLRSRLRRSACRVTPDTATVRFAVRDTGIGIRRERPGAGLQGVRAGLRGRPPGATAAAASVSRSATDWSRPWAAGSA
ncbi:MAG: hypothetical protein MZV65_18595 [Chromatiales bacterium]|nr:hypothetical protein [Chromatiales bacterium]